MEVRVLSISRRHTLNCHECSLDSVTNIPGRFFQGALPAHTCAIAEYFTKEAIVDTVDHFLGTRLHRPPHKDTAVCTCVRNSHVMEINRPRPTIVRDLSRRENWYPPTTYPWHHEAYSRTPLIRCHEERRISPINCNLTLYQISRSQRHLDHHYGSRCQKRNESCGGDT